MQSIQSISDARNFIPTCGAVHFILTCIPVISTIVEKAMYKRAQDDLVTQMLKEKKITKTGDSYKLNNLLDLTDFTERLEVKERSIAQFHILGALVQGIACAILFPPANLFFACQIGWHAFVYIKTTELNINSKNMDPYRQERFL